jgi:hypothetical protein
MDAEDRVRVIHLPREHAGELRLAKPRLEIAYLLADLFHDAVVVLGRAELEELLRVVDVPRELLDLLDELLDARALAIDRLRLLRVLPEPWGERLFVQAIDILLQLRDVKDAPLAS